MTTTLEIAAILQQLEQLAVEIHGEFEYDVPDYKFAILVPEQLEDQVIEAMLASDKWTRGSEGFFYKMQKKLEIGDRVIYRHRPWMGGIKQPEYRIPARISRIKGPTLYDLRREDTGTPINNATLDELIVEDEDFSV